MHSQGISRCRASSCYFAGKYASYNESNMSDDLDTDTAGILIGDGLDVPTSIAASVNDGKQQSSCLVAAFGLAVALGVTLSFIALMIFGGL
jgi:hypothetical protein